jgi:DNA-directed RNA polymerase specialized sigma24 family protein
MQNPDNEHIAAEARTQYRAALSELVESQAGLVRQIAVSYAKQSPWADPNDLRQEGFLAVMDAVRYFDPALGWKFSTYVVDCVRRRLFRWVSDGRNLPLGQQCVDFECEPAASNEPDGGAAPLADLPPLSRALLAMRFGDGAGLAECAEALGVRQGRAKKVIAAGRGGLEGG